MSLPTELLIGLYSLAVVAASLFGGWLPTRLRLTHTGMQLVLSFVGGLMLGVGVLHMIPHSFAETGSLDVTLMWTLGGLLGMFFLIRTFHFHEHGPAVGADEAACQGAHEHPSAGTDAPRGGRGTLGWIGVALGLSVHSFIDGVALGAATVSEAAHGGLGAGVFLAVLLHKPLDALSVTTLMEASGWSRRWQQAVNAGFAMMCPVGAWAVALAVPGLGAERSFWLGVALAMAAGAFLCISLSDLLPEVQFHQHDRLRLSAALLTGVMAAYGIRYLEPAHAHMHPQSQPHAAGQTHVHGPPSASDGGEN